MKFVSYCADDMLRETRPLTRSEKAAYRELFDILINEGGRLPDDDERLAETLGLRRAAWRRIKARLVELKRIVVANGQIVIERVLKLLGAAAEKIAQRAAAGRQSGKNRRRNNPKFSQESAETLGFVRTNYQPSTKEESPGGVSPPQIPPTLFDSIGFDAVEEERSKATPVVQTAPRARPAAPASADFEVWWRVWPHKVRRAEAEAPFATAARHASLGELVAGAERYAQSLGVPNAPAPMNPAKWLRLERWRDEPFLPLIINGNQGNHGGAYAYDARASERPRQLSPHDSMLAVAHCVGDFLREKAAHSG